MLKVRKETIKAARYMTSLEAEEFAHKIGLSYGSYRNYMNGFGEFKLKHILIAQALSGIPIQNFFEEK